MWFDLKSLQMRIMWMKTIRATALSLLLVTGCDHSSSQPKHIQAWIESWGKMGMYLPPDEQIDFLRINFSDVKPELAAALNDKNPDIRQRDAFAIGKIGTSAVSLGHALVARLNIEPERLVRIYLVNALAEIGYRDEEATDLLRAKFAALKSVNEPIDPAGGYADVDEKIYVAAALFDLTSGDERNEYREFVTQWLKPPSSEMNATEREAYWEHRWGAVIALENMTDASSAIPLLESILQEPDAPAWVSVHVPRVLGALKKSAGVHK
jgi:HEAT repeat protein